MTGMHVYVPAGDDPSWCAVCSHTEGFYQHRIHGRCRTCHAPVLWLRNLSTGRVAPIDAAPDPTGNVRRHGDDQWEALNHTRAAVAREAGEELHLAHHVTCPDRRQWGRR